MSLHPPEFAALATDLDGLADDYVERANVADDEYLRGRARSYRIAAERIRRLLAEDSS